MDLADLSVRDWDKKCRDSIFLRPNGTLFRFLRMISGSSATGYDLLEQPDRGYRWIEVDVSYSDLGLLRLFSPELGYVNIDNDCSYLTRAVSRQWRLSYNRESYRLHSFSRGERESIAGLGSPHLRSAGTIMPSSTNASTDMYDTDLLLKLSPREYFSYNQIIGLLNNNDRMAGAINRYIAITKSIFFDNLVILYKNKAVGYVFADTLIPKIFSPAEYTGELLGTRYDIVEDYNDLIVRH